MRLPEDYLGVDTPENVTFGYHVAGIGSRFLAALVDTPIIIVLQVLVTLAVLLLTGIVFDDMSDMSQLWIWVVAALGLVAFAFLWGYYILFEMLWNGQSPGKRLVGIRVMRTDGTPITLSEAIIRNLVRLIDFLPAYYGVGVVTMFLDEQSRRLGDLAAGTIVIRDRSPVALENVVLKPRLPDQGQALSPATLDLPIEQLTGRDIQIVEEYLLRRADFSNRSDLASRLVRALFERMDLVPPGQLTEDETEALLMEIVQASRSRESS